MKNRLLSGIVAVILIAAYICGCGKGAEKSGKTKIVCSNFPTYDFARAVAGESAEIKLLISPGMEIHSYDPTPSDMVALNSSDIFIMIGGESEEWARKLTADSKINSLALIDFVKTLNEDGEEEADEHVWTSPENALVMVDRICDCLCKINPQSADEYTENADSYKAKISAADREISAVISEKSDKSILVADRFPFKYFADYYKLSYTAALSGCAQSTDVSAKKMIELSRSVSQHNYKAVFCTELSNKTVAMALSEQTGVDIIELHSAHNVTKEDFDNGITYVDIMYKNASALERGMN